MLVMHVYELCSKLLLHILMVTILVSCLGNKDYYEIHNYLVIFYAGQTRHKLKHHVINDDIVEENEYFFLNISSPLPSGVSLARYEATKITITDDDGKYILCPYD